MPEESGKVCNIVEPVVKSPQTAHRVSESPDRVYHDEQMDSSSLAVDSPPSENTVRPADRYGDTLVAHDHAAPLIDDPVSVYFDFTFKLTGSPLISINQGTRF